MAKTLEERRFYCIGRPGLVAVTVCAPKDAPVEEVEAFANGENPTGIESPWAISDDAGENPRPCDQEPEGRLHYLLNC